MIPIIKRMGRSQLKGRKNVQVCLDVWQHKAHAHCAYITSN